MFDKNTLVFYFSKVCTNTRCTPLSDGGGSSKKSSEGGMIGLGEILLLISLTCDGVTGAVQERMKAEYGTKSGHMMKVCFTKIKLLFKL